MRYFRATFNPLSSIVQGGVVSIRMHFVLTAQMIYAVFVDGDWAAVPDSDMGKWGAVVDFLTSDVDGEIAQYKLFQEGVPQVQLNLNLIPLWSDQLVPYDASPNVQPQLWPVVAAVGA